MILKGSQRGGARNLSIHLMNLSDNDHVTLHEFRGFVANDLHGALQEAHAISKGTKCEQFMFSLSFNPPKNVTASEDQFIGAIEKAEEKLGLDNQPRAIVLHEKEGRRHAHVVWSRIKADSMTAINLSHFKLKLNSLSRELFLEHEWELPDGLRRDGGKSPLNFTLDEWQQAKRIKLDPREIKQSFIDAWERSDSLKSFKIALEEKGYFLARGDRRGFVALDVNGEVFSVPKWIGIKTKIVRGRLGEPTEFSSVKETCALIKERISDKLHKFIHDADDKHKRDFEPLEKARCGMKSLHRKERKQTLVGQNKRFREENKARSAKINTGLRGLWEKLSGSAAKIKIQNEQEAWQGLKRDQAQRDNLVKAQMIERQKLQVKIEALRRKHAQNRHILAREIIDSVRIGERSNFVEELSHEQTQELRRTRNSSRGFSL